MEFLQNQTTGIKNLIMEEFLSTPIPLPPLSEQERISEHISGIIETARTKREEAKRVYEEARVEVEKRILGN